MGKTPQPKRSSSTRTNGNKEVSRAAGCSVDGINSSGDFRKVFTLLIDDVLNGRVAPNVANAACNAGSRVTRMLEIEHKFGHRRADKTKEQFVLSS